jgi:hypothetical protein
MAEEEYEVCLEHFTLEQLDSKIVALVIGGDSTSRFQVTKLFLKTRSNSVIISNKDNSNYIDEGLEYSQIFNRYSALLKRRLFVEELETSLVFDEIVYNKGQIREFYDGLRNFEVSFLQSQSKLEENILFDSVFICGELQVNELEKIINLYELSCSVLDLQDVIMDCMTAKEICVVSKSSLSYFSFST